MVTLAGRFVSFDPFCPKRRVPAEVGLPVPVFQILDPPVPPDQGVSRNLETEVSIWKTGKQEKRVAEGEEPARQDGSANVVAIGHWPQQPTPDANGTMQLEQKPTKGTKSGDAGICTTDRKGDGHP